MSLPDQSPASPSDQPGDGPGPKAVRTSLAAVALAVTAALGSGWTAPAAAAAVTSATPDYPASAQARDVLPWLAAHTSVRPDDIVAIGPQAVVSLDGVAHGSGKIAPIDVTVREELIDAGLAERLHARSARVEAEVDCAAGVVQIRENTRFSLPDLKGDAVKSPSAAGWVRAGDGTPMSRVVHAACGTGDAAPDAQAASASAPAPAPAPAPTPALAPAPPAAPALAPAPTKVATAPAAAMAEAPRAGPAPGPAPVSASQAASAGPSFRVHLGSYSNVDNAHVAVAELTRAYPGPMKGRDVVVRKTSVNGRDYFLVAVEGFPQRADASAFCKAVHAAPGDCLIRR